MSEPTRTPVPYKLKLLLTIVPTEKKALFNNLIASLGPVMRLTMPAKGTSRLEILHTLGLDDSDRTVILNIVRDDQLADVMDAVEEKISSSGISAVCLAVPMSSVIGKRAYGFLGRDTRALADK